MKQKQERNNTRGSSITELETLGILVFGKSEKQSFEIELGAAMKNNRIKEKEKSKQIKMVIEALVMAAETETSGANCVVEREVIPPLSNPR